MKNHLISQLLRKNLYIFVKYLIRIKMCHRSVNDNSFIYTFSLNEFDILFCCRAIFIC